MTPRVFEPTCRHSSFKFAFYNSVCDFILTSSSQSYSYTTGRYVPQRGELAQGTRCSCKQAFAFENLAFGVQYLVAAKTAFREKAEMEEESESGGVWIHMHHLFGSAEHSSKIIHMPWWLMPWDSVMLCRSNNQRLIPWADGERSAILLRLSAKKCSVERNVVVTIQWKIQF